MMCHSNANAEEFYTADMDFQQAFEVRADLADALCQSWQMSAEQDWDTDQSADTGRAGE